MRLFVFLILFLFAQGVLANSSRPEKDPRFLRAADLIDKKNFDQAKPFLLELTKQNPRVAVYWMNLAAVSYAQKDYVSAIYQYQVVRSLRSPLAPFATLFIAKCYRLLGKKADAVRELKSINVSNLPPAVLADIQREMSLSGELEKETDDPYLRQAIGVYQAGNYPQALNILSRSTDPMKTGVQFLKGLILLKLNRKSEARQAFEIVKSNPHSDFSDDAEEFIKQISKGEENFSTIGLTADLAGGFVSNYYGDGYIYSPLSVPTTHLALSPIVRFLQNPSYAAGFRYAFSWDEFITYEQARFFNHGAGLYATYLHGPWFFGLYPKMGYQQIGSDPFVFRPEIKARVERSFGSLDLGISYEYDDTNPQSNAYKYLAGNSQEREIYVSYDFGDIDSTLSVFHNDDNSGDVRYSNGSRLPLAHFETGFGSGITWSLGQLLTIEVHQRYAIRNYKQTDLPKGIGRRDENSSFGLRIGHDLRDNLEVYASSDWVFNRSTLGAGDVLDKNYSQFFILGGVKWDVLR